MLFSCVFANQHSWKNSCNTCHFPLLLLRYIPSISASYSSLKQAKSSFPSLPPSPYLSLNYTGEKTAQTKCCLWIQSENVLQTRPVSC